MKHKSSFPTIIVTLCLALSAATTMADDLAIPLQAEELLGLSFDTSERDTMLPDLADQLSSYIALREVSIGNEIPPTLLFQPLQPGAVLDIPNTAPLWSDPGEVERPDDIEDLAFYSVSQLAKLIREREVTSLELTRLSLDRLKRFDPQLKCVITLLEERALEQASRADVEIRAGRYRGPLHGIPFGVKDLCAVAGAPTTWGAEPYRDQVIDDTATVVSKLEEAGAVLVAKLTLGALAWGDVWFDGMTRNPWNIEEGSSGSSAGSASAVAAGLVPFAIGTETWGSIISPATRCGVTGLRPTFGRVSRAGAMALSWSMDKIGPICREVEDCAMVFDAIRGTDGRDQTVIDAPFPYASALDLSGLKVGYLAADFSTEYAEQTLDQASLETLRGLGVELVPIMLPEFPVMSLAFILSAEAAAAFDELTRSGRDDLMVRQIRYAWPNTFRAARFIPAVEYIQANRARHILCGEMRKLFERVDLYVGPSFQGDNLLLTNLTGHPCVVTPNGFVDADSPASICFTGDLYDEATLLAFARIYQQATTWHKQHPPGY
ncbi:MAG: amidase [bacterium]|nr:amidase [bacterium]